MPSLRPSSLFSGLLSLRSGNSLQLRASSRSKTDPPVLRAPKKGCGGVFPVGDAARTDGGRMTSDGDGGRVSRDSDSVYVYVGAHTHYSSFHMTQCVNP